MSVASDKQLDLIRGKYNQVRELAPKLDEQERREALEILRPFKDVIAKVVANDDISGWDAKEIIPVLIHLVEMMTPVEEATRWKKIYNNWLLYGHKSIVIPGETITVRSSKGEKQVTVGEIHSTDNDFVYAHPKREDRGEAVEAPGLYWKDDKTKVIEAYHTKSGFLVAREIVDGKRGEYLGKAGLYGLGEPLTIEEIRESGKETGVCMICGKALTDPESVARGTGPICDGRWLEGNF